MALPVWLLAGWWGLVAGGALLIGAAVGYLAPVPQRLVAGIMAFGGGVLISALSFDLMDEAFQRGGFDSTAIGFVGGALLFSAGNYALAAKGAKHRKRSGHHTRHRQPAEAEVDGSGTAIAVGALLDGIPEAMAIGLSMIAGGVVSSVTVIAIFLSNIPEGLSSSSGMKKAGRSRLYIFGVWSAIAFASSVASVAGYTLLRHASPDVIAASTAIAAGAILTMLVDTMIPEAFSEAHDLSGLITVVGFLVAFTLTKLPGL